MEVLKQSGTIGAILNMLHSMNIKEESKSNHIENLINSLHILIMNDKSAQNRILANPISVPIVVKLTKYSVGQLQSMAFDILEALSTIELGLKMLMDYGLMKLLFSGALLYSPKTVERVKYGAVNMIYRVTTLYPYSFPVDSFEKVVLDENGVRRIDGKMEVHLLQSFLHYTHYLSLQNNERGEPLAEVFTLFPHLLQEIVTETFVDLDHVMLILRCMTFVSTDQKHVAYLLKHNVMVCLQYVVRTDFEILRRKQTKDFGEIIEAVNKERFSTSKTADRRTLPTLMALALIKPQLSANKTFDINFATVKCAINIYEVIFT